MAPEDPAIPSDYSFPPDDPPPDGPTDTTTTTTTTDVDSRKPIDQGLNDKLIPIYCSILAAVVVGLVAFIIFKRWEQKRGSIKWNLKHTVNLGDALWYLMVASVGLQKQAIHVSDCSPAKKKHIFKRF